MKKTLLSLLFLAACILSQAGPLYKPLQGPYVQLIKSGKARAQIVIPAKPVFLEEYAASELQKHLRLISNTELLIIKEGEAAKYPYSFYIGNTERSAKEGIKLTNQNAGDDGFELKSLQGGILIHGMNDLGSLFGVYEMLERYFDVRWFAPGDEGLYYPRSKNVKIGQVNLVYKPSFRVRWIHSGEWSLHQRMNAYVKAGERPVGINWKWGYHTYGKIIPPEIYFSEHPEYFSLVKGERYMTLDPKLQGNQLCTSNPEVIREVAKNLIDTLNAEPDINIINFGPDDNQRFCQCSNCIALDEPGRDWYGKYANRFAVFNNEVAKLVREKHPDVLIKVGAYETYARPPLDANFKPADNILFQVCHLWFCHNHPLGSDLCKAGETFKPTERFLPNKDYEQLLDQWIKLSPHLFIYEYYAISGMARANMFWPMIHAMRTDIPYYRNKGIEGFYTQTSGDWARLGLNAYVSSKLCWNADLNVEDLLDDYFQKFYGPASVPMKEFFMVMEKSMQEWNGCASYGLYGVGGLKIIALDILKPAVTAQMEKDLAKAEQLTENDFTSAERVGLVRKAFDVSLQELKNIEAESKLKKKN